MTLAGMASAESDLRNFLPNENPTPGLGWSVGFFLHTQAQDALKNKGRYPSSGLIRKTHR
jgi:hypothetical protein